jgi:type I restriction enzyme R subunit
VIIDAVGITETELIDTQPLERNKTVAFDTLLKQISFGDRDPAVASSVVSRLARLERQDHPSEPRGTRSGRGVYSRSM